MEPNETPKPKNPYKYENIMLWSWILCGGVAFIGLFARRVVLLETVVPVLAFVGFVTLGLHLWQIARAKLKADSSTNKKS